MIIEFKRELKIYKIKELLLNLVKHSNVSYRSLRKDAAGLPEGKESTGLHILWDTVCMKKTQNIRPLNLSSLN